MGSSKRKRTWIAVWAAMSFTPLAAPAQSDSQSILAPGLYVFQTRLDHATCGESSSSGNVTSYFATLDGRPGAREMKMTLMNSEYWPEWTVRIPEGNKVYGDAQQAKVTGPHRGEAHFELELKRGKLVGRGSRAWSQRVNGEMTRCRMAYDALLKPLHD
jgi:hypothetical protein